MKSLEINNVKLQDVTMVLESDHPGTICRLSYPKSEFQFNFEDNELELTIPINLATELFRTGVLPQEDNISVEIKESGRKKGSFTIDTVIYPQVTAARQNLKLFFLKCQ